VQQWGIRVDDAGCPRRHETPVSLWSTRSRAANPLSFTEHRSPQPWVTRFVLRACSTNSAKGRGRENESERTSKRASERERERERERESVCVCVRKRTNNHRNYKAFEK